MGTILKVGITGGIGSGKTTVCRMFETFGIPVFYADPWASYLMEHDPVLIAGLKKIFGEELYEDGRIRKPWLAEKIFSDKHLLEQLNREVHPVVRKFGNQWMSEQTGPYALKEAAILFESGHSEDMDYIIGVTAPESIRIQRTISRDGISSKEVEKRIARQMDEAEKMKLCDFVIVNDDNQALIPQVLKVHEQLVRISTKLNLV